MIVGAGLLALPDWAKREVGFNCQGEQCFLEETQDSRKMHGWPLSQNYLEAGLQWLCRLLFK